MSQSCHCGWPFSDSWPRPLSWSPHANAHFPSDSALIPLSNLTPLSHKPEQSSPALAWTCPPASSACPATFANWWTRLGACSPNSIAACPSHASLLQADTEVASSSRSKHPCLTTTAVELSEMPSTRVSFAPYATQNRLPFFIASACMFRIGFKRTMRIPDSWVGCTQLTEAVLWGWRFVFRVSESRFSGLLSLSRAASKDSELAAWICLTLIRAA